MTLTSIPSMVWILQQSPVMLSVPLPYTIQTCDHDACRLYLMLHFPTPMLKYYDLLYQYQNDLLRMDFMSYCILYHHGGICIASAHSQHSTELLSQCLLDDTDNTFVLSQDSRHLALVAAKPGLPFYKDAIQRCMRTHDPQKRVQTSSFTDLLYVLSHEFKFNVSIASPGEYALQSYHLTIAHSTTETSPMALQSYSHSNHTSQTTANTTTTVVLSVTLGVLGLVLLILMWRFLYRVRK